MHTIETERLIIRPVKSEDNLALCQIRSSEFVQMYNAMKTPTPEVLTQEIQNNNKDMFILELKDTHQIIGEISTHPDNLRHGISSITISCYLDEAFARKGYMYEALHHFLKVLFKTDVEIIVARHFGGNTASQVLLKKLGFVHEGTLRKGIKGYKDIIYDDCIYSLMPDELK